MANKVELELQGLKFEFGQFGIAMPGRASNSAIGFLLFIAHPLLEARRIVIWLRGWTRARTPVLL
jgi:hypothetical protein